MTERLYYTDSYLKSFQARVTEISPCRRKLRLNRTAFYPASGGQPHDWGTLGGVAVTAVMDDDAGIVHQLASPLPDGFGPGSLVEGEIDWPRRFDHMQQHTGQHLLSAVLLELFDAETVSFHLGSEVSTIDLGAAALSREQVAAAEERANALVFANLPVEVSFAENSADLGLRRASERQGPLRIVSIQGHDRSACGGTHVRSTAEIGPILIRRLDKIRGAVRVEFLCGLRAVRRARADYAALAEIGRLLTAPLDETPALIAAQREALKNADRERRKLETELAAQRGVALYAATTPSPDALRRHFTAVQGALDDVVRALAQGFVSQPRALFVATCADPPSVLMAASGDSGIHAGNLLKELVTSAGGRGGGNAQLAQGTVPKAELLAAVIQRLQPPE